MVRLLYLGVAFGTLVSANAASSHGGSWDTLAPIPIAPRQEHGAVALSDQKLAIIGGIVPNSNGPGFNTTSMYQIYDIPSNSWSSAADAPIEVNHPNVAVVDGKVYLLGGLSVATGGAWRAFPESWVYDPITNVWTPIDSMPLGTERGSATVGVHGKKIYLAGGMRTLEPIGELGEQDTVDFVTAFDTEIMSWCTLPPFARNLPEVRDHAGGSVAGNQFYLIGGRERGQRNVKDTVFTLDLDNLEGGWTRKGSRMPTARGGVVTGTVNGKIYIFGGEGNSAEGTNGIFNETEVFDTKTEIWKRLAPMPVPRHGGSAVAIRGSIYLPGGGLQEGGSPDSTFDVYRPKQQFSPFFLY
ncbi:kelch domain-containing protein 8a [Colletotrichum incanum]|uniref:Kelch domain-containing protein 8a n=1 Tax=Colletotrichum incanum TaxID=1573173 RepID=A0A166RQQ0_COLIC|nr:kelch domain-containing protein 8a [Colletotrichum incanum]